MWKVEFLSWLSGEWEDAPLGSFFSEASAKQAAQSNGRLADHEKRVVPA